MKPCFSTSLRHRRSSVITPSVPLKTPLLATSLARSLPQDFLMLSFNPSCYLPSAVNQFLPTQISCPPPATLFTSLTGHWTSTYRFVYDIMGAILSIPLLSFLLIPTMTSYSTSLNLLFFYLTWSTLVLSHPPLRVELVSTLAIRIIFYVIPSSAFLLFDAVLPSAAESFKATSTTGLPFYGASRSRTLRTLRQLGWSLSNVLITTLIQALLELLLTRVLSHRSALKITTTLPMPWSILTNLVRGLLLRELFTYIFHRYLLHSTSRSSSSPISTLTRLHNTWYHSIPAPYPLSATYDHPIPHLIHHFLPTFLPAYLFRFHLLTYLLYLTAISLEETFTYSGYSTVPTNFILGGIARRTDNHVLCNGEGNYGCWGLVDWVMGTSVGGDVLEDVVNEADRRDVVGRVGRGSKEVGRKVKRRIENGSASASASATDGGGGRRKKVPVRARKGRSGSEDDD